MDYRTPPPPPPLVILNDKLVQAFDSATGRPLWQRFLSGMGYARTASTGETMAICIGRKVLLLEMTTGRELLETDLWFDVNAIVSRQGTIAMVGSEGLACFSSTGYLWGIRSRRLPGGFFDNKMEFAVENARGEPFATIEHYAPLLGSRSDLGLVLGEVVFQPDISG
jgi:hypothetical protein